MEINDYQRLAARTINTKLSCSEVEAHALYGLVGEVGELHSLYQKMYQGHAFDNDHAMKELGDLLWFIAEYATAKGWTLRDVAQANVDKLRARYPDGFRETDSLHRKTADI